MTQEPKNWIGKKFALMDILLNSAKNYGISSKIEFADSGNAQCEVNLKKNLILIFYVKSITFLQNHGRIDPRCSNLDLTTLDKLLQKQGP